MSTAARAPEPFGSWLQREMEKRKLTQTQLADKSGVERSQLNRALNGHRDPTADHVEWIATALGLPLEQVLKEVVLPLNTLRILERYADYERELHAMKREVTMMRAQLIRLAMTPIGAGGCRSVRRSHPRPNRSTVIQSGGSGSPQVPESNESHSLMNAEEK